MEIFSLLDERYWKVSSITVMEITHPASTEFSKFFGFGFCFHI